MHAGSMHANIHEIMQFDWCHNLLTHALITTYLSNICEAAVILSAAVISIMASTEEKAKHLTIIMYTILSQQKTKVNLLEEQQGLQQK